MYAEGGAGGAASNAGTASGGTGSSASSIGTIVYPGGNGATGVVNIRGGAGGGGAGSSGAGGNASGVSIGTGTTFGGGNGGAGRTTENNGLPGSAAGGGGGGAYIPDNTDHTGGSGGNGMVVISLPYFSYGNNDPNNVNNWWSNTNGTGTHPANFTTNNQIFIIQSGSTYTTTSNWTVSGASTMVRLQNGGILRANNAITFSAATTFQIDDGGTYLHNHNTNINIFSGINILGASSTVNYMLAGAQTVAGLIYGNLTLSGSGAKITTGVTVNGVLSMEGTATASAAPIYGASATLQYNTASPRNAGPEWLSTFTASGGVIIANTGIITLNAAKIFNTSVP